jgi:hypothetical protein
MEFCKNTQNNQSNLCPSTIKHLPRQPAGGPPLLETASNELKCAISVFAQNYRPPDGFLNEIIE